MSRLKTENLTQCVSLLRDFIDESSESNYKKGLAKMALEHLQKITAGKDHPGTDNECIGGKPKPGG